ncbi:stage III sporulation protein AF [Natronincola ferrireducens]|uniref:Stage III sporulation protein AF n=1 Tax=Natronincola ferrireducens TaxID=393762 RepID=A0A1G9CI02_9FIRM|nr:stage III sporulation protein AF [Natronincola ferrireducens]SDK51323.1 stage III sporulation protein AF [Natronincola ferrireducens]
MDIIREWIITIVSIIVFITFVEILIPNSDNKRYINVVVGLLIMIVILSPVFQVIKGDVDLGNKILEASNQMEHTTIKNTISHQKDYVQTEMVMALYKENLIQQMEHRIEAISDYGVENIQLEVEEKDQSNLGMIYGVDITLKAYKKVNIEKKDIEPVKINVLLNENDNTVEAGSILIDNEGERIKNDFSIYYNLPKDNINIYILKDK